MAMNHEELKAYINHYGTLEPLFVDAMLAVVELHKPYQGDKGYTIPLNDCVHCSNGDTPYPCPTIQAIINQL